MSFTDLFRKKEDRSVKAVPIAEDILAAAATAPTFGEALHQIRAYNERVTDPAERERGQALLGERLYILAKKHQPESFQPRPRSPAPDLEDAIDRTLWQYEPSGRGVLDIQQTRKHALRVAYGDAMSKIANAAVERANDPATDFPAIIGDFEDILKRYNKNVGEEQLVVTISNNGHPPVQMSLPQLVHVTAANHYVQFLDAALKSTDPLIVTTPLFESKMNGLYDLAAAGVIPEKEKLQEKITELDERREKAICAAQDHLYTALWDNCEQQQGIAEAQSLLDQLVTLTGRYTRILDEGADEVRAEGERRITKSYHPASPEITD